MCAFPAYIDMCATQSKLCTVQMSSKYLQNLKAFHTNSRTIFLCQYFHDDFLCKIRVFVRLACMRPRAIMCLSVSVSVCVSMCVSASACACACVRACVSVYLPENEDLVPTFLHLDCGRPPNVDVRGLGR